MIKTIDPIPISSFPFSEMLIVPIFPDIRMRLSMTKKLVMSHKLVRACTYRKYQRDPNSLFRLKKQQSWSMNREEKRDAEN